MPAPPAPFSPACTRRESLIRASLLPHAVAAGNTPLHLAAKCNRGSIVRCLVAAGADMQATGYKGLTPRQLAERHKSQAAAIALRLAGRSRRTQQGEEAAQPVHFACLQDSCALLCSLGASMHSLTLFTALPLQVAPPSRYRSSPPPTLHLTSSPRHSRQRQRPLPGRRPAPCWLKRRRSGGRQQGRLARPSSGSARSSGGVRRRQLRRPSTPLQQSSLAHCQLCSQHPLLQSTWSRPLQLPSPLQHSSQQRRLLSPPHQWQQQQQQQQQQASTLAWWQQQPPPP